MQQKTIKQIKSYFENKVIRIEASDTKRKLADYKKRLKSEKVATNNKKNVFDKYTNKDVAEMLPGYFTKAVMQKGIRPQMLRVLGDLFSIKGDARQRLKNFGKSVFVKAVENRVYGHNSEETIELKGFDKKYYATGQLEKSINTYIKYNYNNILKNNTLNK